MTHAVAVPANALVVLIGAAGSGKSTFAARWFPADVLVSSDRLRAQLAPAGKKRRTDVFGAVLAAVEQRMARGVLTVVDATNTDWMRRAQLIGAAGDHHRPSLAIVFALPVAQSLARNRSRPATIPASTVRAQAAAIERDLERLDLEGFDPVVVFRSEAEVDAATLDMKKGPGSSGPSH